MIAKLVVASGKNAGRAITIKRNKLLIGRAEECDIRPLSEEVSRRHCAVHAGPADVFVEDLGSRNGTFVNGVRITEKTKVASGDLIRVGSLELKVSCSEPASRGNEDDVSRWLMADEAPAGMFDTTHTLRSGPEAPTDSDASSIHVGVQAEPSVAASVASTVSGILSVAGGGDATVTGSRVSATSASMAAALDAIKDAKGKPSALPKAAAKGSDSSRDAAAEALKKFFGNR